MVAANVGEHLISPNLLNDPEEFVKTVSSAARGSIGDEWGHLAGTLQGRTVQAFLSQSDAQVKALAQEWKMYEGERGVLGKIASILPGTDERKLWKLAKDNPEIL